MSGCRWMTLEELTERESEWRQLALTSDFPNAFVSPAWILAWWHNYGKNQDPWLFVLEDRAGSLRGVALLALRQSPLARTLTFAAHGWSGLETLLCAPGGEAELSASLLQALADRRREWDVWRVQRLPVSSVLADTLLGGQRPLRSAAHDVRPQPYIELPDDVATFEASFSAKERGAQRRKWRRLAELGASPRLITDPRQMASSLHVLFELRRERAIALGQSYKYMDERYERFILEVLRRQGPEGARLWTLESNEQVLASHLHFVQGPREHTYMQGNRNEHMNLSPGNMLKVHAVCEAIREGRAEIDLGPGLDEYKYHLGARDRMVARLVVASGSLRGRGVTRALATDLRLRNTAAAEALRRRKGIASERATPRLPEEGTRSSAPPADRSIKAA
jgi:CelD/BcsL family acetyltransferase involved in cellulose biosynthesis